MLVTTQYLPPTWMFLLSTTYLQGMVTYLYLSHSYFNHRSQTKDLLFAKPDPFTIIIHFKH
jgi:hypothetical protein